MMLLICVLFLATYTKQTLCSIENIELNYTRYKLSFDELYDEAIKAYQEDNYRQAVTYLERALSDYRQERDVKAHCRKQCNIQFKHTQVDYSKYFDGELSYVHYFLKMKSCTELCKEKFLGRRGAVAKHVRRQFENRQPYNYIQFSYYKINEVRKALDATFTYLEVHPTDKLMQKNLNFYLKKLNLKDESSLHSLEEGQHVALYSTGMVAYNTEDFDKCVENFESSLTLFYKELDKCQLICEEQHEKHQASYSASLFQHFKAIMECRYQCYEEITRIGGKQMGVQNFLSSYYHFLQYCYNYAGKPLEAGRCAETYLMILPTDAIMMRNLAYYQHSLKKDNFKVRERAKVFHTQMMLETSLYNTAKGYANPLMTDEQLKAQAQEKQVDSLYERYFQEEHQRKGEDTIDDSENSVPVYRNDARWKSNEDVNFAELLHNERELNGTERVAFDGVSNSNECETLMKLVTSISTPGNGYEHQYVNSERPFTEKESFEGVSIIDAVNAVVEGKTSIEYIETYLNVSERVRLLVQEYFDLRVPLNFAFTHLVCRHSLQDAMSPGQEHLSHPIHSDNCVLRREGKGSCPKVKPAYVWRDYSALLYLNNDFEGGDFIFADYRHEIQARVRPKCGRMVAFRSNGIHNLHGVLGVTKGVRCALPIWFTLSPTIKEDHRPEVEQIFEKIKKQQKENRKASFKKKYEL